MFHNFTQLFQKGPSLPPGILIQYRVMLILLVGLGIVQAASGWVGGLILGIMVILLGLLGLYTSYSLSRESASCFFYTLAGVFLFYFIAIMVIFISLFKYPSRICSSFKSGCPDNQEDRDSLYMAIFLSCFAVLLFSLFALFVSYRFRNAVDTPINPLDPLPSPGPELEYSSEEPALLGQEGYWNQSDDWTYNSQSWDPPPETWSPRYS